MKRSSNIVYVEVVRGEPVRARMYVSRYNIWEVVELPPGTPVSKLQALYAFAKPRGAYLVKESYEISPTQHISSRTVTLPEYAAHIGAIKEA